MHTKRQQDSLRERILLFGGLGLQVLDRKVCLNSGALKELEYLVLRSAVIADTEKPPKARNDEH